MNFIKKWVESSLVLKILIGSVIGTILGVFLPSWSFIGFPGELFVNALKSIAPILVFLLIASSISKARKGIGGRFKTVILLYLCSTFLASLVAVAGSYLFPVSIYLSYSKAAIAQSNISEIMYNMILGIFSNPIQLISEGQYLGILFWSFVLGIALKSTASDTTKSVLKDCADAVTKIVWGIIQFAPIGIMCLVFTSVSKSGIEIFVQYGQLIGLLVGCILFVGFVTDPFLSAIAIRRNPYPLVFTCLRESGITAFFSRSSAANIPINLRLCQRLGLDKDFFSISIPLGAAINMEGAAITITVMSLAVCHTMGISVPLYVSLVLSIIATLCACGASGVTGGSLLLIPMACSLFGISGDVAMQAVGVGFIIGIIQDSCETALNSAGDVLLTATAEYHDRLKNNKPMNFLKKLKKKGD